MPEVQKPTTTVDDATKKEQEPATAKPPPPPPTPVAEIKSNVALLERAVTTLEPRFTHRVLRSLNTLRKRLDDTVLRNAVTELYTKGPSIHLQVISPAEAVNQIRQSRRLCYLGFLLDPQIWR